jgi:hypothetical protein
MAGKQSVNLMKQPLPAVCGLPKADFSVKPLLMPAKQR